MDQDMRVHSSLAPQKGVVTWGTVMSTVLASKSGKDVTGFLVQLHEYNGQQALMIANDVGKRRRQNWSSVIREGRSYPFIIKDIRQDAYDKEYVDEEQSFDTKKCNLTISPSMRITDKEVKKTYGQVYKMLRQYWTIMNDFYDMYRVYCEKKEIPVKTKLEVFENTFYPYMDDKCGYEKRHLHETVTKFLEALMLDPKGIFEYASTIKFEEDFIEAFVASFKSRLQGESTLGKLFMVRSLHEDGVLHLNKFFDEAMKLIGKDKSVKLQIFSPPFYKIVMKGNDVESTKKQIDDFMEKFSDVASKLGIDHFSSDPSVKFTHNGHAYNLETHIENRIYSNLTVLDDAKLEEFASQF